MESATMIPQCEDFEKYYDFLNKKINDLYTIGHDLLALKMYIRKEW